MLMQHPFVDANELRYWNHSQALIQLEAGHLQFVNPIRVIEHTNVQSVQSILLETNSCCMLLKCHNQYSNNTDRLPIDLSPYSGHVAVHVAF